MVLSAAFLIGLMGFAAFAVDVGYIAWGAAAAASPDRLLGPGGQAILPAGCEGYSGGSWSELSSDSPAISGYMTLLFGCTASTAFYSASWGVSSL